MIASPSVWQECDHLTPPAHASQALFDLEATNAELKNDLRDLYITSAQEIDVSSSRKAIVIHVRPATHFPAAAFALHVATHPPPSIDAAWDATRRLGIVSSIR